MLEARGRNVESTRRRGPAKLEAVIEDTAAPHSGEVAQIMGVLCTTGAVLLDKSPKALPVEK